MNLDRLNPPQREAVLRTEGAVLVLAGAGSGKTSVLTHRIAYLIEDKDVRPWNILALTFTNKAAAEMKERISRMIGKEGDDVLACTFHSFSVRMLRRDADKIGFKSGFSIYDRDDCVTIVKGILKDMGIDPKEVTPASCLSKISMAKNGSGEDEFLDRAGDLKDIYEAYTARLERENAMDFDDLLINALRLLRECKEVREYYQNKFRYILVDEYQDTNSVQYEIVRILAEGYGNIFAVGDDDQSIYGWRGADIRNILDFERDFPSAHVIKLEQNYRSQPAILDAANAVIMGNPDRHDKKLWSAQTRGDLPVVYTAFNDRAEAEYIAREINKLSREGMKYSDCAVLYRMRTQSRVIEEYMRIYGIPYSVFGGMSFFERKEVKDMLAYLTLVENPDADTAFGRVVNVPRRGVGNVTLTKIARIAAEENVSHLAAAGALGLSVYEIFDSIIRRAKELSPGKALELIYEESGYRAMLTAENNAENETRRENIAELISGAYAAGDVTITEYLESMALYQDLDTMVDEGGVTLMTMHSAKGLEFDTVFMPGMEETIFPSRMAVNEGRLDEERRLCYVGITRAKKRLYMLRCRERMIYADKAANPPSRFLGEIPKEMVTQLPVMREVPKRADVESMPQRRSFVPQNFTKRPESFGAVTKKDTGAFAVGVSVRHPQFGKGTIKSIVGEGDAKVAVVAFAMGEKKMYLAFAPLTVC